VLAGEAVAQVADSLSVSVGRVERWQSKFVAGGREALGRDESEARRHQGALARHRKAILQWAAVAFLLVAVVAVLARMASTSEP
jgi:hypothetical protein